MAPALTGVEPRHLAALAALAQAGSVKGAAERLGYAQSAVSQLVTQLERVLGTPVVVRAPGQLGVEMTPVGTVLARHGRDITAQLDAAGADLRGGDELRVGVHDRAVMDAFPRALALLAAEAPALRVSVCDGESTPAERAELLRRGRLDAALDDFPLVDGPFASVEVLRDPIVLVVPASSPLAVYDELDTLDALDRLRLVADVGWSMLPLVDAQLDAAGVHPETVLRSRLATGLQPLVAAGIGAALMPRMSVDVRRRDTAVVALGDLVPPRRVALYWHRDRRRLPELATFRAALDIAFATLSEARR